MLVHLCLSVLLSLMSDTVFICMIIFEPINDDDDDEMVSCATGYNIISKAVQTVIISSA